MPAPEPEVDIKRDLKLSKLIKRAEIEKHQGCFCYKGTLDRRNQAGCTLEYLLVTEQLERFKVRLGVVLGQRYKVKAVYGGLGVSNCPIGPKRPAPLATPMGTIYNLKFWLTRREGGGKEVEETRHNRSNFNYLVRTRVKIDL